MVLHWRQYIRDNHKVKVFKSVTPHLHGAPYKYGTCIHRIRNILISPSLCNEYRILVNIQPRKFLIIRNMMSGRTINFSRAAYFVMDSLTNYDVTKNTKSSNYRPLTRSLVHLSLDHEKGAPQHKTAILNRILNHRFPVESYYEDFMEQTQIPIIETIPHVNMPLCVVNEMAALREYHNNFSSDIAKILVAADTRPLNVPPSIKGEKQSNPDFWVTLRTKLDGTMGYQTRQVLQDEKSGMDMFKHSTSGSIGLLTYDETWNNVQVMREIQSIQGLIKYNRDRINGIKQALQYDNLYPIFKDKVDILENKINTINKRDSPEEINSFHQDFQQDLWRHLQSHPLYNRSLSFVFVKQVPYKPFTEKQEAFHREFCSLLQDKLYDPNKNEDRIDITLAMLVAYKRVVDPQAVKKVLDLHYVAGVELNDHFMKDVARFIKEGLL